MAPKKAPPPTLSDVAEFQGRLLAASHQPVSAFKDVFSAAETRALAREVLKILKDEPTLLEVRAAPARASQRPT
jgi:hypothetical protein